MKFEPKVTRIETICTLGGYYFKIDWKISAKGKIDISKK